MARLSVIGTGYLGVTHAVCMSALGHDVIGLDTDASKIELLRAGEVPFHEPGLAEMLTQELASGRLRFTTDNKEVAESADVHFICVGTPQKKGTQAADLSQVDGATAALAPHLTSPALVVGKSTVPVGTAGRLADYLRRTAPAGDSVTLAWNPEFLREGFAVNDTLHPDRIVIGTSEAQAESTLRHIYAQPISEGTPVVVTDYATAELVKVAANAFLATKISFINSFAALADATGADITLLADAIGHDTRIGRRFLNAGVGFGGGCLPKDIRALMARAQELGVGQDFAFLNEVDGVNQRRRTTAADRAIALAGGDVVGKRVAVLGAAFKPDSDDIRDSPALGIANDLRSRGALVAVHDPIAIDNARKQGYDLEFCETVEDALRGAHVVVHATEWGAYRQLDAAALAKIVAAPRILDGRNVLDREEWTKAGWTIDFLGRPGS